VEESAVESAVESGDENAAAPMSVTDTKSESAEEVEELNK
jgi:hypothetical protein